LRNIIHLGNAGGAWLGGVALVSGLLDRKTSASFDKGDRVLTR